MKDQQRSKFIEMAREAGLGFFRARDSDETSVDALERFAELIVQECVQQCWAVSETESRGFVVSKCVKKIRKHFGVY